MVSGSNSSNSSGSIQSNQWGPITWNYLHLVTFMYPVKPTDKDKAQVKKLFQAVAESLPCETCRKHFTEHVSQMDKHTNSMSDLSQWLVEVHNSVNKRLNKPVKAYKDVAKLYKCDEVSCPNPAASGSAPSSSPPKLELQKQEYWAWLIVIAFLVLLLFVLVKRR
jgi:hypothetical protein